MGLLAYASGKFTSRGNEPYPEQADFLLPGWQSYQTITPLLCLLTSSSLAPLPPPELSSENLFAPPEKG